MKLYYVFDPLCVFSYGFNHLISKLYMDYKDRYEFELIPGGLWVGDNVKIVSEQMKENLTKATKRVTELSGQSFGDSFYNRLQKGYRLDSDIGSRAFNVVKDFSIEKQLSFLTDLYEATFVKGIDVNDLSNYEKLTEMTDFKFHFDSNKIIASTEKCYFKSKKLGVTSFPTLLLEKKNTLIEYELDYSDYSKLETWLKDNA